MCHISREWKTTTPLLNFPPKNKTLQEPFWVSRHVLSFLPSISANPPLHRHVPPVLPVTHWSQLFLLLRCHHLPVRWNPRFLHNPDHPRSGELCVHIWWIVCHAEGEYASVNDEDQVLLLIYHSPPRSLSRFLVLGGRCTDFPSHDSLDAECR